MLIKKNRKKVISILISMILVVGSLTSFAYAEDNLFKLAKEDLKETAAAKIMPEVKEDLAKEDILEVLVYLKDQIDTEKVAEATRKAVSMEMTPYNTKLQVRRAVVESLKDKAEITQSNILKYLEQEKEKGNVEEYKPYYIVNMVYVKGTKEVVENLSYMTEVEKIYKNKTHQLDIKLENEELNSDGELEWNIERVKADLVWDLGIDGTGAVVGSLDSGVDWTHPALKNKWRGYNPETDEIVEPEKSWYDPVYGSELPADSDSHGTHVMGTMVGQEPDGSNKVGVAPGAKWISARVFDTLGYTTDAILLDAAEWMLAPGGDPDAAPDAVNNSWGGLDGIDDWYRDAVRNWRAAEILPVFSAGNQRSGEPEPWPGSISVPANYPESFAVAATDINNLRASFSKLGPSPYDETLIKPEMSAPGVLIRSSIPGGGYTGTYSGTSMAAPHVTATAALLVSADSSLTVDEIEDIITRTAQPLTDEDYPQSPNFGYGYGLVDAFSAVSEVVTGIGTLEGKVLGEGEDLEGAVIEHEQEVTEVYMGSDIEIEARITDDVAVTEAELLVQPEGKTYWFLVPMTRVSGDHKDGIYKGTITYDMLIGDSIKYKIRAKDYSGEAVVTEDYTIEIKFGIVPDEYVQGFEEQPVGWIFTGSWQWGKAVEGVDPEPFEGEGLAGTVLGGNYLDGADDLLITPPIDLRDSSLEHATLRFNHWYKTYNSLDYGTVYITDNYGEDWVPVSPEYFEDSEGWKEVVINLDEYIGSTEPIFVAFRFVSSYYSNSEGWYIDNVRLVGVDTEAPSAPTNLIAESKVKGIKLEWDPSQEGDLDHYNIYRSETSGGEYTLIAQTTNNSYVDMEAPANIEQYYVVTAVDFSENESEYSNEASAVAVPYTQLFGTDFEEDNGGFITGVTEGTANDWEWGVPTSGPNAAASGEKLWATNLDGNYTANNDSYIESPAIEIPEGSNAVLTFTHWYDFEGTTRLWDYGQVLVSNDDGETWTNITPTEEGKYGTRAQKWFDEEISLSEYTGDTIKIRFYFHSDGSVYYNGWYIDDVYVMAADIDGGTDTESIITEIFAEYEPDPQELLDKESYVEPEEINFSLKRTETYSYEKVSDEEIRNTPLSRGRGIPIEEGTVTILETGRTVKADPATGEYTMTLPAGTYTLRAEAYGYFAQEAEVTVEEDETTTQTFILEEKPKGSIKGRVFDRYYGNPASNAVIRIVEDSKIEPVIADEEGNFEIPDVYIGTYTLKVIADGFEPGEFEVTVEANEETYVELGLKKYVGYPAEIAYDDGTAENALVLNSAPNGLAVRFTPEQTGKVKGLNIYLWGEDWPTPGGNRLGFAIYDIVDGEPVQVGEPIFIDNLTRGDWNYIDLSSFGFTTDRDFFISTIQDLAGTNCPGTGIDEASEHGDRSYLNIGGDFQLISDEGIEGALMMRAVMEYSVSTPVITNLEEINYVNTDTVTVEGTVETDSKINVYVNNEKVTSLDTEDLQFAVEIELQEERNEIMVTAELDGEETEPSPMVVVIKDQELPVLTVNKPEDNAKFNVEVVHIVGNVVDNIGISELLINNEVVEVDENGDFYERVIVDEGENLITIRAIDLAGNEVLEERTVYVELTAPEITNIEPSEDVELRAGDTLIVSFNAPTGGEGYFRILLPYENQLDSIGISMEEIEEGLYEGTWTAPEDMKVEEAQIEIVFISEYGNEVKAIAEGKVTIIDEEEVPEITNIEPSEDVELRSGETLTVRFNAPTGGEGYFRILLPYENQLDSIGISMEEIEEGLYEGTWTAPENTIAVGLEIEVIFISDEGVRIISKAEGKITILGAVEDLPSNTIIVDDEAYDIDYLNNNSDAQNNLIEWLDESNEVYFKLSDGTIVNLRGELTDITVLPERIIYYNSLGEIAIYVK